MTKSKPADVKWSGNRDIDALIWKYKWDSKELTYSFPTSEEDYEYYDIIGFQTLNINQKLAATNVIESIAGFSGLKFKAKYNTEFNGKAIGDIAFGEATAVIDRLGDVPVPVVAASGVGPDPRVPEFMWGDMWFNHTAFNDPKVGSYAHVGLLHELGHALGLSHGHEERSEKGKLLSPFLSPEHDSGEFSVMTYNRFIGDDFKGQSVDQHAQSYMQLDIAALQYLYGANYGYRSGDTVYTFDRNTGAMLVNGGAVEGTPEANFILRTIWDGGGEDTYDFSNYDDSDLVINLNPGAWTKLAQDQIAFLGYDKAGGTHFARGNIANALLHDGNSKSLIENAIGGDGDDVMRGNVVRNHLEGEGGNDTLDGRGGRDKLEGGSGDDLYILGSVTPMHRGARFDQIVEEANGGKDSVTIVAKSLAGLDSFTLPDNVENASVSRKHKFDLIGNQLDNRLTGNAAKNELTGKGGNDTLDGGRGKDTLIGGAGDDTYVLRDVSLFTNGGRFDKIIEKPGQGIDTVEVQRVAGPVKDISKYKLPDTIENGKVIGSGAFDLVGNGLDNHLTGNAAGNTLRGGDGDDVVNGGKGRDFLVGGDGDDTYWLYDVAFAGFGAAFDLVTEQAGQGIDTVQVMRASSGGATLTSYALTANVENGTVAGGWAFDLAGNGLDNVLTGNTARNVLAGGDGNDTIDGGGGDDDLFGGNGNDTLVGGAGDDDLDGGIGTDRLEGGAGQDTHTGGADKDTFVFRSLSDSAPAPTGRDEIIDFTHGQDRIDVAVIDAMASVGGLQAFTFVGNGEFTGEGQIRATQSGADTILEFNTAGGAGAEMAIVLANLSAASLTGADFVL